MEDMERGTRSFKKAAYQSKINMERWPSGLRQQFTKLPSSKGLPGFESLSLRLRFAEAPQGVGEQHVSCCLFSFF